MRKLKLQVQLTLDGYVGGPKGETDWMELNWDKHLIQYVEKLTDPVDTILLGRKLAEGFIPHWENIIEQPNNPEYEAAVKYVTTPKIIFSKMFQKPIGKNTTLANGNLVEEVTKIKNTTGKDIIVYGGATFVSALIKHQLIDEFYLFINPTTIGNGLSIFKDRGYKQNLSFVNSTAFRCGIVVLQYILYPPIA